MIATSITIRDFRSTDNPRTRASGIRYRGTRPSVKQTKIIGPRPLVENCAS